MNRSYRLILLLPIIFCLAVGGFAQKPDDDVITVDSSNGGAVNDFQQATMNYKAKCKPDCSRILPGPNPPPSNQCDNAAKICR